MRLEFLKKIYIYTVILLEGCLFFVYDNLSVFHGFIYGFTVLFLLTGFKKKSLSVAGWWLCIYILCAFIIIPLFHFIPSRFTMGQSNIRESSFDSLASTTFWVIFFFFASICFFYHKNNVIINKSTPKRIYAPKVNQALFFFLSFLFTYLSYTIGIGKMGVENVRLPFHLSGIIQFSRMTVFPILGLCIYARKKNKHKKISTFLILYFVWALFEAMVRLSKSALLSSFLPMIIYELLCDASNFKQIIKKFSPIVVVVLIMYPIIETLRHSDDLKTAISDSDEEQVVGTYSNPYEKNRIVKPFNRQFLSGYLFLCDSKFVDNSSLFDFSHLPVLLISGGSARYQTLVLDGYPPTAAHSSGTTPFIDGFLVGGYGMLYLSVIIMVLLARLLDSYINKNTNYIILSLLIMSFYGFFDGPLFTYFLSPIGLQGLLVVSGICLFIHLKWKFDLKKY